MHEVCIFLMYEYGPMVLRAHCFEKFPFAPVPGMSLLIAGVFVEIAEVNYSVDDERFAVHVALNTQGGPCPAFKGAGHKPSVPELADVLRSSNFEVEVFPAGDKPGPQGKGSKKQAA